MLGVVAISEAARSDLYTGLSEVIGPERAETLMSAIPLHDRDEFAKRGDVEASAAALEADIADVRAELKTDIADLRAELKTDIADLRAELKTDIADLRAELGDLRAEMVSEIAALRRSMTNWMLTLLVTIVAAMVGLSFMP
jgi:hypothetical protein